MADSDAAQTELDMYFSSVFRRILTDWGGSQVTLETTVNEKGRAWLEGVLERKPGGMEVNFIPEFREYAVDKLVEILLHKVVEVKKREGMDLLKSAGDQIRKQLQANSIMTSQSSRVGLKLEIDDLGLHLLPVMIWEGAAAGDALSRIQQERYKVTLTF